MDGTNFPKQLLSFNGPAANGTLVTISETEGDNTYWDWDWKNGGPITPRSYPGFALNVKNHTFMEGNTVILYQDPGNYPMSFSMFTPSFSDLPETNDLPCPIYTYAASPSAGPCISY
jgi:hypothetical protein